MSTSAIITMHGTNIATRVHYDGYTDALGVILCDTYTTPADAASLTAGHDLISIPEPNELPDTPGAPDTQTTLDGDTPKDLERAALAVGAEYVYIGTQDTDGVSWKVAHAYTGWRPVSIGQMILTYLHRASEVSNDLVREAMYTFQSYQFDTSGPTARLAHRCYPSERLLLACWMELRDMESKGVFKVSDFEVRRLARQLTVELDKAHRATHDAEKTLRDAVDADLLPLVDGLTGDATREVRLACVAPIIAHHYRSNTVRDALTNYLKDSYL